MRKYRGVEGGTTFGDPLCRTCRYAQWIRGKSFSQELLRCSTLEKNMRWEAYECSFYEDKRYPPEHEMREIAWVFVTDVKTREIGFVTRRTYEQLQREGKIEAPEVKRWE